jgi:hypothetical protein
MKPSHLYHSHELADRITELAKCPASMLAVRLRDRDGWRADEVSHFQLLAEPSHSYDTVALNLHHESNYGLPDGSSTAIHNAKEVGVSSGPSRQRMGGPGQGSDLTSTHLDGADTQ